MQNIEDVIKKKKLWLFIVFYTKILYLFFNVN